MSTLALILGILSFLGFGLALLPCLGWLNWLNIPFSIVSVVVSIVALAKASNARQPTGTSIAALVLSVIATIVGFFRLVLGGGVF